MPQTVIEIDPKDREVFAEYFNKGLAPLRRGDIVKGHVLEIRKDHVVVDIGFKSEGVIPISDILTRGRKELGLNIGDEVEVYVDTIEGEDGHVLLSKRKADQMRVWEQIGKAFQENHVINGLVLSRVKGGLTVDLGGVNAFLPGSQVDFVPVRDLERFEGQELEFRIIKFDRKTGNVVLSRKILLEKEREELRSKTLEKLVEGQVIEGTVKNITDYGVFLDLGGVDGLLHITDISWGRVNHPGELFKTGDHLNVMVLKFDRDKMRVSLGLKQTRPDPWQNVQDRYAVGARVLGKVVNLVDYGAFVELEEGIEGLIHVSEMSWTQKIRNPSQMLNVGDEVDVMILEIDGDNRRISLGLKQTQENPWDTIMERYPIGKTVDGVVKNFADFGMFVGLEDGIDGLVHVSDMSWTKRIKNPSKVWKKGDAVKVKVLNVDPDNGRLSLGVKQLEEDPWNEIPRRYRAGQRIHGKVTNVTDFGVFVEIEKDLEGLVHISELPKDLYANLKKSEGEQDIEVEIINIDPIERKIALALVAEGKPINDGHGGTYTIENPTEVSGGKLGDVMKNINLGEDGEKS